MHNFIGTLQPVVQAPDNEIVKLERICGSGVCEDPDDAVAQLRTLYKREHPEYAAHVDNKSCMGGVIVFDCTLFEVIERAADETSAQMIRDIYDEAIELAPFVEQ